MTGRTILERIDATLAAGEKPTRDPAPFHLRKVYPPDNLSVGFPWRLEGPPGAMGATRFRSAADAYRYVRRVTVEARP